MSDDRMYLWNAEEYCASSSDQRNWALELLSKLDLKGNERVLDIGCGDGEITVAIAQRVPLGSIFLLPPRSGDQGVENGLQSSLPAYDLEEWGCPQGGV